MVALWLAAALLAPDRAAAQPALTRIGVAAAVRGSVKSFHAGLPKGPRLMASGDAVYLDEKLETGAEARMQVLLEDETVFTIGPNSAVILDRFIYDPSSGAGEVSANVTKGVFRFVTGKIAKKKPSNMRIKTPMSTIGVRGTMALLKITGDELQAILLGPGSANNADERAGSIAVENFGETVIISRPGFGSTVEAGRAPSAPTQVSPAALRQLYQALAPKASERAVGLLEGEPGRIASSLEFSGQGVVLGGGLSRVIAGFNDARNLPLVGGVLNDFLAGFRFPDRLTSWEDLRRLETGSYGFAGSAPFIGVGCVGGAAFCTGVWGYNLTANFATRLVSGSANITTANINDATAININYSNPALFTGPAASVVPTTTFPAGCLLNGPCAYGFTFSNEEGIAGKQLQGTVIYNDGANSGIGTPITTRR